MQRSQTYGLSSESSRSSVECVVADEPVPGARESMERLELDSDVEERLELVRAADDEGS